MGVTLTTQQVAAIGTLIAGNGPRATVQVARWETTGKTIMADFVGQRLVEARVLRTKIGPSGTVKVLS